MADYKLLIVDDDKEMCQLLQRYLQQQGEYQVDFVHDGVAMFDYLQTAVADLIILDIMLPGDDGLSLARRLDPEKQRFMMLSARGEEIDRIVGLELGADDYLAKPFNPRELLARIKAVLRRQITIAPTENTAIQSFADFRFNSETQQLFRHDTDIGLTSGEADLLAIFLAHDGKTLTRDRLMTLLNGVEAGPYDRSIDIRVNRLRRKIEEDPSQPLFIRTVWGKGYIFHST